MEPATNTILKLTETAEVSAALVKEKIDYLGAIATREVWTALRMQAGDIEHSSLVEHEARRAIAFCEQNADAGEAEVLALLVAHLNEEQSREDEDGPRWLALNDVLDAISDD